MHAEGQARRRWPGLDGLRGIAVLAVLGFHAGIEHFVGGYLGVEVFFALSGFLITTLLLDEFGARGRIDLRAFWSRRARRILPALFLVVAITGVLWAFVGTATQRAALPDNVLAAFAFGSNWHEIATGTGYLAANSVPSPLLHTWSIAIEEQWYLLWPLVILGVFALLRRTRRALMIGAGLCVAGAAASCGLMAYLAGGNTGRAYYGTDTRAAALLVGAALAFAFCHGESARAKWLWSRTASRTVTVLAAVALTGLGITGATVDHEAVGLYRGGFLLVSLATVAVVVACVHPVGNPIARLLSIAPLRWVGAISYGIYLWHWPVFLLLTPDRTGLSSTPLTIVRVVISIALAWLSWHLIEQPIRLRRVRPRIWVPASTAAAAAAIAVLVLVSTSNPGFKLPAASALRKSPPRPASSSNGPARPHLFFAGDSIALTLGAGVSQWADQTGRAVVTGHPLLGCGLMDDIERRRPGSDAAPPDYCTSWNTRWRLEVARHHPDAALLVLSVWDLQEHAVDGKDFKDPGDAAFDRAFLDRLDAAVGALSSSGARVGLVTLPLLGNEDAHAAGIPTNAIPEEQPNIVRHVNEALRRYAVTHQGIFLVDIAREARGETQHPQEYHGVPLFADGSHFTPEGAAALGPWMLDQVKQALASPSRA
jgi:peptidoglycan/LPS O-acetylase OafA/YrhL